jgi:hypothetical protein
MKGRERIYTFDTVPDTGTMRPVRNLRLRMTIKQKRLIIDKAEKCPNMTQEALAEWARSEFKLRTAPHQATVSVILKKAAKIKSEAYGDGSRRRILQVRSERLETRLGEWVQELEEMNVCLSRALIEIKARELQGELCDAWDLSFSDGWMTAFMRRHGLRFRVLHGEAASVDPEVVQAGLRELQQVTDEYLPANIFNMDETGLCYAMAPARSICSKKMRGTKKDKTRITLAFAANANGTDVLEPLIVGRAMKPRCFKGRTAAELGFYYRNNSKAWMRGDTFREWLLSFDRDMRAAGRHVLLLLDNASSHSTGDLVLSNVKVRWLPPNTTALLQPMDAGIIAAFKRAFRKKQLVWVYNKLKRREAIGKNAYKIDQLEAMRWSKDIWNEMRGKKTFWNCFRHTNICFQATEETNSSECSYDSCVAVDEIVVRVSQMELR